MRNVHSALPPSKPCTTVAAPLPFELRTKAMAQVASPADLCRLEGVCKTLQAHLTAPGAASPWFSVTRALVHPRAQSALPAAASHKALYRTVLQQKQVMGELCVLGTELKRHEYLFSMYPEGDRAREQIRSIRSGYILMLHRKLNTLESSRLLDTYLSTPTLMNFWRTNAAMERAARAQR